MKPLFRKITQASTYSFSYQECQPLFDTPWHFHPEYELILLIGSSGKRFMGDSIAEYNEAELVLIGPNLPHFWQNEKQDLGNSKKFVIHFTEHFLGEKFFQTPESYAVQQMLKNSARGIKFNEEITREASKLIPRLGETENFERLILLLQILNKISSASSPELLASNGFVDSFRGDKDRRINKVYEYVIYNFKKKITLSEVASVASMSEIAFCRYFKSRTGKSFFTFLNEIRIGYGCRLLIESNLNVTEVCYHSGFNNLSNFNRQFKEITKNTPQRYRNSFTNRTSVTH